MLELAWIRGAERLLVVCFGGMSIYLGYRLFFIAASNRGSLDAAIKDWKLSSKNLAPGVFFSLFGMVVLSLALSNSLSLESSQPSASGVVQSSVRYVNQPSQRTPRDKATEIAFALLQVERLLVSNGSSPQLVQIQPLAPKVSAARHVVVESASTPEAVEWYSRVTTKLATDPSAYGQLSKQEQEDYEWLKQVLPSQ